MIIWHDLAVNLIWISKRWWKNSTGVNNTSIFGIYCSLWVKVHLFSFISFTVENYIQSQANRNVVSQASQMGDKSHFFNFLNQDIEIFTHSWHTYKRHTERVTLHTYCSPVLWNGAVSVQDVVDPTSDPWLVSLWVNQRGIFCWNGMGDIQLSLILALQRSA